MIVLLVMTDGRRECIEQTIASARANLAGPITRAIINDDSDDRDYTAWLREAFPAFEVIESHRAGFGGAIRNAWSRIAGGHESHVLHLEDDFTFNRPVYLVPMAATLDDNAPLVQLALRRQPWNDEERAAGGIVESHPDDYEERLGPFGIWLEHRRFFTTNPSLYRRTLCWLGWPEGDNSEGVFTHQLLADPDVRFGYWGARDGGEWVTHIGRERVGTGY